MKVSLDILNSLTPLAAFLIAGRFKQDRCPLFGSCQLMVFGKCLGEPPLFFSCHVSEFEGLLGR